MKDSLAVAYAMKRRKAQAAPESSKVMPDSDRASSIVEALMKSKKGYAEGGMVDEDPAAKEMEDDSHSGDDFLSLDSEPVEGSEHMPEDPYREVEGTEDSQKKLLSKIMAELRMSHMGK